MTKAEALEKVEAEQKIIRKKDEKRRSFKRKLSLLCLGGVGVALLIGVISNAIIMRNERSEALSGSSDNISEAVLSDQDVFIAWEDTNIGNDINCLMSGGMFYRSSDLQILPDENVSKMLIAYDGTQKTFLDNTCSYINRMNDVIVYRDDNDHGLYQYSLNDGSKTLLCEGNIGEIIGYKSDVFFQDLNDSNRIYKLDLSDSAGEKKNIGIDSVKKFFVYNDRCVYITDSDQLYNMDLENNDITAISGNFSNMFFNGKLLLQSGNRIISSNADGNDAAILYENVSGYQFVGASDDGIFIIKDGKLYKEPMNGSDEVIYEGNTGEILYSVLSSDDGVYGVSYTINEDGTYTAKSVHFTENIGE